LVQIKDEHKINQNGYKILVISYINHTFSFYVSSFYLKYSWVQKYFYGAMNTKSQTHFLKQVAKLKYGNANSIWGDDSLI
jgi:hypothetical protein